MFALLNQQNVITAISKTPLSGDNKSIEVAEGDPSALIGRKVAAHKDKLRVALITNWEQECGISTYSKYLLDALRPLAAEIRIFSEVGATSDQDGNISKPTCCTGTCDVGCVLMHPAVAHPPTNNSEVDYCWVRGQSMLNVAHKVLAWNADFVIIQHEFGLFPKASYMLQLLQLIDGIPYAVTLHSTYEHLDKSICTSAMKHIIVHTESAKKMLRQLGHGSRIDVIPHGCIAYTTQERKENWNIFQTPYVIMQFGFGFQYKGVDRAIDAVNLLKTTQPEKYKEIFYVYLCSENSHTKNIHNDYYESLRTQVRELQLDDNVVIIRKYHSDKEINNYLRTAKLAIFPYLINHDNTVYGASGAIRIAMANGIPVLASENHLFDELPVPRPNSVEALAQEIDKIFSHWEHRQSLITAQDEYVTTNSWTKVAEQYMAVGQELREEMFYLTPTLPAAKSA